MAIIAIAAPLSGIRGTLAGVSYSANHAGPYAHQYRKPIKHYTLPASAQRASLSALPAEWLALSDAERSDWDTWAALAPNTRVNSLGETYYLSGAQWFTAINRRLDTVARAHRTTYPAASIPPAPTITSVTLRPSGDAEDSSIVWPSGQFAAYDALIFLQLVSSAARMTYPTPYPLAAYTVSHEATGISFQPQLESLYGQLTVGQRGFWAVARQHGQGTRSTLVLGYSDVVAS